MLKNMLRLAAHHGPIPFFAARRRPIDRDSVVGRALVERQLIHIEDLAVVERVPRFQTFIHQEGTRTYGRAADARGRPNWDSSEFAGRKFAPSRKNKSLC